MPFGGGCRYDMAVDMVGGLKRVQVKTGRVSADGSLVVFNTTSNNKGYKRKSYHGEVDFLGVYCTQLDRCYMVPVSETGSSEMKLRLTPSKNGQVVGVKMAADYQI